ncbi:MAG: T9SS type A sorting domain-containing protein [Bacteroidota bacterium]
MKKFTLVFAGLCIAAISFGQVIKTGAPTPVKDEPVNFASIDQTTKGSGDIFWSTTFNWGNVETNEWELPAGWTIVDNTDFGNPWIWRSPYDTLGGCCTWQGPSTNFLTPLDGYLVLPSDEYNRRDGVGTSNAMDTYIITSPIDCSSKGSVVVKFIQLFRLCCGTNNLKMSVTNDGGVHWAEYDCLYGLSNNRVTDLRYQYVEFNISDVAAGLPNVQIKFHQWGNTHYYWMIDDLRVSEAFDNDLILEDYWLAFNGGYDDRIEQINYWPLSQMGMAAETGGNIGDYLFSGAMLNNGNNDQENTRLQMTILKNGAQVWQEVSEPATIWTLERDTLTANTVFLANDYGDYQIEFKGISDNSEEVPVNNSINKMFTVNDTLFHRADFTAEAGSNTGGWVGGANAGDMVGVGYDIYKACEVNSMIAQIGGVTTTQFPQFQYVLFKDMGEDGLQEYTASDVVDATAEMRWTWQTLEIIKDGETEFIEPGFYIACVRMWGTAAGDADGTNGISVGWDMDNRGTGYAYMYQAVGGNWYGSGKINQIGININETGAPTAADVTFNVDMNRHIANNEFHPGTDLVDVVGFTSVWMGPAAMTDADGDGIYTVTVAGLPVASKIEYKYRVNGVEEAYPTTGNLHRNYTVRYWNIINSRFNNGVTTGIPTEDLLASFSVYPNPTSGSFTVNIVNTVNSDLTITLTNIEGQVIYRNVVKNTLKYEETIDNQLAKGLYFLSVNNGKEVKVQKVIVE